MEFTVFFITCIIQTRQGQGVHMKEGSSELNTGQYPLDSEELHDSEY